MSVDERTWSSPGLDIWGRYFCSSRTQTNRKALEPHLHTSGWSFLPSRTNSRRFCWSSAAALQASGIKVRTMWPLKHIIIAVMKRAGRSSTNNHAGCCSSPSGGHVWLPAAGGHQHLDRRHEVGRSSGYCDHPLILNSFFSPVAVLRDHMCPTHLHTSGALRFYVTAP